MQELLQRHKRTIADTAKDPVLQICLCVTDKQSKTYF